MLKKVDGSEEAQRVVALRRQLKAAQAHLDAKVEEASVELNEYGNRVQRDFDRKRDKYVAGALQQREELRRAQESELESVKVRHGEQSLAIGPAPS